MCVHFTVQISVTGYHKLGVLHNLQLFLEVVEVGGLRPGGQQGVAFGDGPLPGLYTGVW